MTALAAERRTPSWASLEGYIAEYTVAANQTIYAGAMVRLRNGELVGGLAVATDIVVGRAEESVTRAAGAAAVTCRVRSAIFRWDQLDGSTVDAGDIGKLVRAVDDQTIRDDGGTVACYAGCLVQVDTHGAWVATGPLYRGQP